MPTQGKHIVRQTLYLLKKRWGVPITWYKYLSSTFNVETGATDINWDVVTIRHGILLPRKKARPESGTPFKQAGYFDTDRRYLIIDIRDLPRGWVTTEEELNDKIIIDDERYQLSGVDKYEQGQGYMLTLEHVVGSKSDAIVTNNATLDGTV